MANDTEIRQNSGSDRHPISTFLVINCNHWVGYHVVTTLLDEDYLVEGIEDVTELHDLSMYYGRNSSFSFYSHEKRKRYETSICIGDYDGLDSIHADRIIMINPTETPQILNATEMTVIHAPFLFGEWMPMNENGFYHGEDFISFQSNTFRQQAIYIGSFTSSLIQSAKFSQLPKVVEIKSEKSKINSVKKLENSIYISENIPIEKSADLVLKHYRTFNQKK